MTGAGAEWIVSVDDERGPAWELLTGLWRFSAAYAMVELNIADHLADGALPVPTLAERCGADVGALRRLMRALASYGLLTRPEHDTYVLSPAGERLRSDDEHTLRPAFVIHGEPASWRAMRAVAESVRTGTAAFSTQTGMSTYEYYAANPELGMQFDTFMTTRSTDTADAILAAYDFSDTTMLVDVGGGRGTMLAGILRANPHLRGTLFDLPRTAPEARTYLESRGVADRCEVIGGDFFTQMPPGDTHLLSNVVHNLPDDRALTLLRNVAARTERVLLVDVLLPEGDQPHFGKDLDMRMLAMFGAGRERTAEDYLDLVERADLTVEETIPLPQALSIVLALPRRLSRP